MAEFEKQYYQSIGARSIVVPELALSFVVTSLDSYLGIEEGIKQESADDLLRAEVPSILGIPESNIMTFSRWSEIASEIRSTLDSDEFYKQMQETYGGNDDAKRKEFQEWLRSSRVELASQAAEFKDSSHFAELLVRKVLLNPRYESTRLDTSFLNYSGDPSTLQSVFGDLLELGVRDLELFRWQQITTAIGLPILPSTKRAYANLQEYQIPIPGSPKLNFLTLDQYIKACRGAAFVVLSATAIGAAAALGGPGIALAVLVAKGSAVSLSFITVGQIAQVIEQRLSATAKIASPSGISKRRRAHL